MPPSSVRSSTDDVHRLPKNSKESKASEAKSNGLELFFGMTSRATESGQLENINLEKYQINDAEFEIKSERNNFQMIDPLKGFF